MENVKNELLLIIKPRTENIIGMCLLWITAVIMIVFEIFLIVKKSTVAFSVGAIVVGYLVVSIISTIRLWEFYEIYRDRIIVRNPVKILNITHLSNVKKIEEIKIVAEHQIRYFYILNDGRQYCNSLKMPQNARCFNLYLLKTEQSTTFIKEQLQQPIIDRDPKQDYEPIIKKHF